MEDQFDVSVVMSTYNRCELLPKALESVLIQEHGEVRFEVIVVDNNSTDRTREVVESFIARGHSNLRYIFEGRQGLSYGLNAGITSARGEIIALTDDDICVARNWVVSIKRTFDEHPEVDFIGGKVLPVWKASPPAWLTRQHWAPLAITDPGDDIFYVNKRRPHCLIGKSFRRTVFEEIGLFSPELGRIKDGIGSAEDHDLQMRIWRAGGQGMYAPDVVFTSEIDPERLTKAYHRRWHIGHGKFCAMMRIIETSGPDGELAEELPDQIKLFGVPGFLYRSLLLEIGRWLAALVRKPENLSFECENQVRYLIGYIRKRYEESRREERQSHTLQLMTFLRSLIHKKVAMREAYPSPSARRVDEQVFNAISSDRATEDGLLSEIFQRPHVREPSA
jgi:glycosyltransferase involved in cell wall biosynthesis